MLKIKKDIFGATCY